MYTRERCWKARRKGYAHEKGYFTLEQAIDYIAKNGLVEVPHFIRLQKIYLTEVDRKGQKR